MAFPLWISVFSVARWPGQNYFKHNLLWYSSLNHCSDENLGSTLLIDLTKIFLCFFFSLLLLLPSLFITAKPTLLCNLLGKIKGAGLHLVNSYPDLILMSRRLTRYSVLTFICKTSKLRFASWLGLDCQGPSGFHIFWLHLQLSCFTYDSLLFFIHFMLLIQNL